MTREESLLKLLKTLAPHMEKEGRDGFVECPHCPASGWGFLEHKEGCPVLEARGFLRQCRHGYTGGYDHGTGHCPALACPGIGKEPTS